MSAAASASASDSTDVASSRTPSYALADPQRRQMLRLVRSGELAAGQIATHFAMTTHRDLPPDELPKHRAGWTAYLGDLRVKASRH